MIPLQRHRPILPFSLRLLYTSALLFSVTSAFSVGYNERCRVRRPLLLLQSALVNDDVAPSFQISHVHHNKSIDDFHLGVLLRCWNVSMVTLIALTIILLPSPSVASIEQVYSTSDGYGAWSSSAVIAAEDLSSISPSSIDELGLKPPTEQRPQIMLNGRAPDGPPSRQTMSRQKNAREPILQGLVYFPERAPKDPASKSPAGPQEVTQKMDYYSDVLVLTAVSATQPEGLVLAGAKFPVSSVRFPFSFQMFKENLLTSRPGVLGAWENLANTGDIIVRANICPSDASTLPCDSKETKKYAEGVAKIITNLPGLKEGEVIRAPASLPLQ